ncbi:hypothetical protein COA01_29340 [Bacillus cereus]|uniref:hypothetical protein n=1 Tax=Bacillus cereus TaxID=1396 RepID=UPI000BFD4408|nr:hypothetical protein [Bacillus cereus]PGP14472.1 hypothetical protein COA01_29340 [Bacillus cereus]
MSITEGEQKLYENTIQSLKNMDFENWAATSFADKQFRLVFIKTMSNLIQEHCVRHEVELPDDMLLKNNKLAKSVFEDVLRDAFKVAVNHPKKRASQEKAAAKFKLAKPKELTGYGTGKLAEFFGVSVTTINNWIGEGRFLWEQENGRMVKVVRKTPKEKIKIHPDTWFDAPSGVRYQVKEVAEAFQADQHEWESSKQENTVSEQEQIQLYLDHFKKKYNGEDFNAVFGNKNWDSMTSEEETDAAMWSFFLQRISDEENTRD